MPRRCSLLPKMIGIVKLRQINMLSAGARLAIRRRGAHVRSATAKIDTRMKKVVAFSYRRFCFRPHLRLARKDTRKGRFPFFHTWTDECKDIWRMTWPMVSIFPFRFVAVSGEWETNARLDQWRKGWKLLCCASLFRYTPLANCDGKKKVFNFQFDASRTLHLVGGRRTIYH